MRLVIKNVSATVFLTIGLSVAHNAIASSWYFTWAGNEETTYFFDADTIEKTKDNITVWIKTVQVKQADSDGSWASAYRWKFNCSKRTIQALQASIYDKDGKFIKSFPEPSKESATIPDSTGEAMQKIVCASSFPKVVPGANYVKLDDNDVFRATRTYSEIKKSQIDSAPK